MDLDRILKPEELIDRLKYAEKQCVRGYYYILIRPDVRDRIVELLKEQKAVEPYIAGSGESFETAETWWYECGNCNKPIDPNDKFCRHCGRSVKWMSKPYNMNNNLEECPLDTLVILTDEYNNMYLGTITKERGRLTRGECIHGDVEQFYRNKIIGWEAYCPT